MNLGMKRKIIVAVRQFRLELSVKTGEALLEKYPDRELLFYTFYHDIFVALQNRGFRCIYIPEELNKVKIGEEDVKALTVLDKALIRKEGVNVNLMLQAERFLPKSEQARKSFALRHFAVFNKIIGQEDISVTFTLDHFVYWLVAVMVNFRKGFHFTFMPSGIPQNRVFVLRDAWHVWDNGVDEDAAGLLKTTIEKLALPPEKRLSYMAKPKTTSKGLMLRRFVSKFLKNDPDRLHKSYFALSRKEMVKDVLMNNRFSKRIFRGKPLFKIDYHDINEIEGTFCYFPLQMEPEMGILFYSPWFKDQVEICRLMSQALPYGWKIILKENPKMLTTREQDFYDKITAIPNVFFANPKMSSTALIKKAELTFAISGTATIEALLLKKKSIAFGRAPASFLLPHRDFSAIGKMDELTNYLLEEKDVRVDIEKWKRLLRGTLAVDLIPKKNETDHFEVAHTDDIISKLTNYIERAIVLSEKIYQ